MKTNQKVKKLLITGIIFTILSTIVFIFCSLLGFETARLLTSPSEENIALIALIPYFLITSFICTIFNIISFVISFLLIKKNKVTAIPILSINLTYLLINVIIFIIMITNK